MKNVIGNKYGLLTVVGFAPTPQHIKNQKTKYVYCDCDCGSKNIVKNLGNITSGLVKSCGCINHLRYRHNEYQIHNNYVTLYDFKKREFYISIEDLDKVLKYTWFVNECRDGEVINAQNNIKLHRFIMNVNDSNMDVDHINHNRSDNRRENLRVTSPNLNNLNKGLKSNNTSGCTGVFKSKNKWASRITVDKKVINLGTFINFEDAVAVRKAAEEKYFGEYSYDNSMRIAEQNRMG